VIAASAVVKLLVGPPLQVSVQRYAGLLPVGVVDNADSVMVCEPMVRERWTGGAVGDNCVAGRQVSVH
jgi:hypothetical protein